LIPKPTAIGSAVKRRAGDGSGHRAGIGLVRAGDPGAT
jgi:hypothetical protein